MLTDVYSFNGLWKALKQSTSPERKWQPVEHCWSSQKSHLSEAYLDHFEVWHVVCFGPHCCAIFIVILLPLIMTITHILPLRKVCVFSYSNFSDLHLEAKNLLKETEKMTTQPTQSKPDITSIVKCRTMDVLQILQRFQGVSNLLLNYLLYQIKQIFLSKINLRLSDNIFHGMKAFLIYSWTR